MAVPIRITRRLAAPLALAAIPALAATAVAVGSPDAPRRAAPAGPEGVVITPLAQATIPGRVTARSSGITVKTAGARDVLSTAITVDPAGTFGWHTHPGPVIVSVASGTLTLYEAHGGRCTHRRVGPGKAFVDTGGDVHLARNEGPDPVQIYATFLAPKGTTSFLTPVPAPGGCSV
jgi:quercetin dioxygenase-like cupin family protein